MLCVFLLVLKLIISSFFLVGHQKIVGVLFSIMAWLKFIESGGQEGGKLSIIQSIVKGDKKPQGLSPVLLVNLLVYLVDITTPSIFF